ncbi:MAG: hypothetical protein KJ050_06950 [Candidatus Omnitrophica bacterium]|nr:hypothetical protein [bacterium]MBK7495654.1 hypothetical protein [Candidatus Omnitrophota bacterium]MBV6482577.1 hypothetical protein [bacterium]MCC6733533.1 hypothetical protein [Candidatus Omnitrophota bacterium]MCL4734660.1 hypothetical protein [Candidatus Omnitrophota bacterium]
MKSNLSNFERIHFLRLLFNGYLEFREIYKKFQAEGAFPRARIIEQLCQEVFDKLRTSAHKLYGGNRRNENPSRDQELLCDVVVGACYHEILQLQENLFLVKLYRPRYEELQSNLTDQTLEEFFRVGHSLIAEAESQIPKNLNWIWQLLQEIVRLQKILLVACRDNRVLLRFLTQNLPLLMKVYDREDLDEIFNQMFPGGVNEALWHSAEDMIRSAHYRPALDHLSQLLSYEKPEDTPNVIGLDRIHNALHEILGNARMNRDNDLVNRCEMLIVQTG